MRTACFVRFDNDGSLLVMTKRAAIVDAIESVMEVTKAGTATHVAIYDGGVWPAELRPLETSVSVAVGDWIKPEQQNQNAHN